MKKLFLLIGIILLQTNVSLAQGKINPEAKARKMAATLLLDDKTAEQFLPLYCEFQNALMLTRIPETKANAEGIDSDEAIGRLMEARFESRRQRLEVEQKYYKEFKKMLSMRQLKKLYESPDWDTQHPK